ncbi:E3 ubiquitin-protein ligase TRIM17 isoform X2 [Lepus europaeus]|uniref:E3 ubiquitin-protein ligase TRIM17 isoform X2 n=1 Tax=Lepus europaeus TaxID=9983 RepID=UPI002B4AAA60|nr:E3 ubiquitin-protein ligase TRIM17 isoform X2 [Lepus europaeus]XP_062045336.1 E3 ubiquitin-protein ligase TRIM17 isoform X2 [Lepus europaeus]XP_062045337.1 E3 ubiquitin-protein ligase TRIM17 isoform X2 [Lepus europaeus]
MDAVELARKLQEEATCSICLDYFTDPVMTACGHNFCRECIRLSWEKAKGKKGRRRKGSFPCPECREMSPQRNLRPNRLLTKVAEMARQHPGLQKRDLCQVHQEPLKLFCEEDKSPICVVCREAREHRLHRVLPVEEAVQEYKSKLEADMECLREEVVKTEKMQAQWEQALAEWQAMVKERRTRILVEFEKMTLLLVEEERRLLQALKEEEEETTSRLSERKASLDQQSHTLEMLLLRLEDRSQQEPLQMLQDMKDTLASKDSLQVLCSEATPPMVLRTVCRVPGQVEVLRGFQGKWGPGSRPLTRDSLGSTLPAQPRSATHWGQSSGCGGGGGPALDASLCLTDVASGCPNAPPLPTPSTRSWGVGTAGHPKSTAGFSAGGPRGWEPPRACPPDPPPSPPLCKRMWCQTLHPRTPTSSSTRAARGAT